MSASEQKDKKLTPESFLDFLMGEGITLALIDDKAVQGKLVSKEAYDLLLEDTDKQDHFWCQECH